MTDADDAGPYLTFGQLYRWHAYGSPSRDALGTIGQWMRAQFSMWKDGHDIQPVKSRRRANRLAWSSRDKDEDPVPSKVGVAGILEDLGWSAEEFAQTFDFDAATVGLWMTRKKSPRGRDYRMLLAIRRSIEALSKNPERLSFAADAIGLLAEAGTLKVHGQPAADEGAQLQAVPPIDFNGTQFAFDPITDEADLVKVITESGRKRKVTIWRGLRFQRENVLASFPRLGGVDASKQAAPDQDVAMPAPDVIDGRAASPRAKQRRVNPDKDLKIKGKIKQARAAILRHYPSRPDNPNPDAMALEVVGGRHGRLPEDGYGFESIKQFINGSFKPAINRGYKDPWSPPPK
jgi:hypothetical protein